MSESMDKKSFMMLAAYIAESVTDDVMIKHFQDSIDKYNKAKASGKDEDELKKIFVEMSLLSYVNVVRMVNKKASELIATMDSVDRVFDLINPNTN